MKSTVAKLLAAMLFATAAIALTQVAWAAGPQEGHSSAAGTAGDSDRQSVDRHGPVANGVYAVLREGPTRKDIEQEKAPHLEFYYDYKYIDSDPKPAPKYVALDPSSFVPLILERTPEIDGAYQGHPTLTLAFAPEHRKLIEDFSRAHLGGVVATVIDNEIITLHKVRAMVTDGQVKLVRCTDNACEILRIKLMK